MKLQTISASIFLALLLACSSNQKQVKQITDDTRSSDDPGLDSLFLESYTKNRQWPSYRGFYASGYLDNVNLPDYWNISTGENILWSTPIPGLGLSCPVIWNNSLFVTTAVGKDQDGIKTGIYGEGEPVADESVHEWKVLCLNKLNGEIIWERVACKGVPEVKRHPKSSHANPTMATNGEYVIAFFGSEGLYCYNIDGEPIWEKDFGYLLSAPAGYKSAEWEFASSPIIHEGKVVIQADVNNTAFLTALDIETGESIWKATRKEDPGWCTPNIYYNNGKALVAVNGYKHRGGYDLSTGEEIWKMSGGGDVPVPTPLIYKDLLFFNSAHGKQSPILAIEKNAEGDLQYPGDNPTDHIRWHLNRGGAYLQTMLVYNDLLYNMKWNGNLSCYHPETGELFYKETVSPGSFISSPIAADGKIYVIDEEGNVYIIKAGKEYELLEEISLGEITLATPAITDDILIFRTVNRLIAVSDTSNPDS